MLKLLWSYIMSETWTRENETVRKTEKSTIYKILKYNKGSVSNNWEKQEKYSSTSHQETKWTIDLFRNLR